MPRTVLDPLLKPTGVSPQRRRRTAPFSAALTAGLLAAVVSACTGGSGNGTAGTASGTVDPQPAPSGSQSLQPPVPTGTPPGEDPGDPAQTVPGQLVVRSLAPDFNPGEPVRAEFSNGTGTTVYVENLRTACSIAVLQRLDADWVSLPDCGADRKAAVLAVGPGRGRSIEIPPAGVEPAGSAFPSGTYRVSVAYRTEPGPEGLAEQRVHSEPFNIR